MSQARMAGFTEEPGNVIIRPWAQRGLSQEALDDAAGAIQENLDKAWDDWESKNQLR
jgi:hypothetical protein